MRRRKIAQILYEYGDVKLARTVAKSIVKNRPISTSFELNEIIRNALPAKIVRQKIHQRQFFKH